jgi:hydrogenase expression/formation protein HypC
VSCTGDTHCVTCADEGIVMRVVRVDEESGLALCAAVDGTRTAVDTALVDPVGPGAELLVHAGVALVALNEGAPA